MLYVYKNIGACTGAWRGIWRAYGAFLYEMIGGLLLIDNLNPGP